jgi:hypothetical protein
VLYIPEDKRPKTGTRRKGWRLRKGLALLREFVANYGWDRFKRTTVFQGFHLGHWVCMRRAQYREGKLPVWLKLELERIPGWTWDPVEDRQRRNVRLLRKYVAERGWKSLKQSTRYENVNLGMWVNSCRQAFVRGTMPDWLKTELETIPGWSWSRRDKYNELMLAVLCRYVDAHGWRDFRHRTTYEGMAIGTWATRRRRDYRHGRLPEELKHALESISGWTWDPVKDRHKANLDLLRSYLEENGWDHFRQWTRINGERIGVWVSNVRTARKRGTLATWLKEELESIPGWQWSG